MDGPEQLGIKGKKGRVGVEWERKRDWYSNS